MTANGTRLTAVWLVFAVFVVYGSLVPLDYRPLPPGEAWARFQQIPFLNLGVGSRADWIANGVLYAPLGFLGTLALLRRGWWRLLAVLLAVGAAWVLAVAVEYTQLFFPPRTVSLNDLLAEGIGSVVGAGSALVAWSMRARWRPLRAAGTHWLHDHGLALYVAVYLAYSLFPYDLLISGAELAAKLASDRWGWWLAGGDGRPLVTAVRLAMEVLLAAPLGAWLAARRPGPGAGVPRVVAGAAAAGGVAQGAPGGLARLLVGGLAIGLALELAQLLIATGVSQGASVLTRACGVLAGGWLWARRADWRPARVRALVLGSAPWLLPVYVAVLLGVNGWFSPAWGGLSDAAETLARVRWQPFYYHYYTSEAQALLSLTSVAFSYGLVGLWVWARRSPASVAALLAALLCAVVEAGKLFVGGLRPDPTNLGIAAVAAALVVGLADRWAGDGRGATAPAPGPLPPAVPRPDAAAASTADGSTALWLLAAVALAWQLASAPPLWLPSTLAVLAVAAVIGWRPALAPVLFAVALPLWDLAPWTGRALWDDFDLLLAVGLAVAWARTRPPAVPVPVLWKVAFGLLAASLGVSALVGFWPGAAPDANALASYHSPYNALRIVKGLLWAALGVGLWRRLDAGGHDPASGFGRGMVLGLAGVVAWMAWERWAFVGLSDWDAAYRVTGPFSAMHRGGALVECYLAVAMPFAAQAMLSARHVAARVAAGGLVLAGSLAMMLTFSRNGYAALAVALGLWALFALRAQAGRRPAAALAVVALLVAAAAAAWPVLQGGYAQERLAQWERDLGLRVAHWQDALAMRDGTWSGALFGAGLGRFPELHYWQSREPQRAARLRVERGGPGDPPTFLRMGGGALTYLDQVVRIGGAEAATLTLRLRGRTPAPVLTVSVCEKWMLTSVRCVSASVTGGPGPGDWTAVAADLDLSPLANSPHARPVKLALHAPSGETVIDVAEVSLVADDGRALLRNGDFGDGFDGWWLSTDVDPPYKVHSLPVAVLLEQGWFGVLAWGLMLTTALAAGAAAAWQGRATAIAATAALAAFCASASLNTLVDDPRFLLLVLMLAWGCVAAQAVLRGAPAASGTRPVLRRRPRSSPRSPDAQPAGARSAPAPVPLAPR